MGSTWHKESQEGGGGGCGLGTTELLMLEAALGKDSRQVLGNTGGRGCFLESDQTYFQVLKRTETTAAHRGSH